MKPRSDEALTGPQRSADRVPLLEARDLTVRFRVRRGVRTSDLVAADHVSLTVHEGEVVAVVGESGSGKSTVARALAQLQPQTGGTVLLAGEPVNVRGDRAFRQYVRAVQLVFQDPFASLNPLHTVRYHLVDPLRIHHRTQGDGDAVVRDLLERVRLTPAERYIDRYPHELSGGQRQRVSIARALAAGPRVLLADEPVSMLDVSIRLGILDLLAELKRDLGVGILYITHDIASARHFADRVLVMYAGQIVEEGGGRDVVEEPLHPYTRLLIGSAPDPDARRADDAIRAALSKPADPPSLASPPAGCRFHPRCPFATAICSAEQPPRIAVGSDRHVACWAWAEGRPEGGLPVLEPTGAR